MARHWIVQGDITTSGGRVITWTPFTDIDGKGVARLSDQATCPSHKGTWPIVGGCDPTIIIDGQPVALHGATLACGCKVLATQQMRVFVDAGGGSDAAAASAAVRTAVETFARQDDVQLESRLETSVQLDGLAPLSDDDDHHKDTCEARFKKVSKVVLANEGGFVNDPDDAGGATNMGIAWRTWQSYAKSDLGLEPTLENLKGLSHDQAEIIYRKRYWEPRGFCNVENPRTALMIYDWTITSGKAVREVQKVLVNEFGSDVTIDNAMGGRSVDAINEVADQDRLVSKIATARKRYYESLTYNRDGSRNKNEKFLNGWLERVDRCLGAVK